MPDIIELLKSIWAGIEFLVDAIGSIFLALNLVSTLMGSAIYFFLGLAAYIPVWIYVVFMAMVVVAILFLVVGR